MGSYIHLGEAWRCQRFDCSTILYAGIEAYCHTDGTIECMACRPKPAAGAPRKVLDVQTLKCVACGAEYQTPNADSTACSSKCKRRLKRQSGRSAEKRHQERG